MCFSSSFFRSVFVFAVCDIRRWWGVDTFVPFFRAKISWSTFQRHAYLKMFPIDVFFGSGGIEKKKGKRSKQSTNPFQMWAVALTHNHVLWNYLHQDYSIIYPPVNSWSIPWISQKPFNSSKCGFRLDFCKSNYLSTIKSFMIFRWNETKRHVCAEFMFTWTRNQS